MKIVAATAIALAVSCILAAYADAARKPKSFTLWQLPEQTHSQMMSYVIRTPNGKVIVIDGGMKGDADYLRKFLKEQGNHVHAWFFSHPHSDHTDAPVAILSDPQGLTVDRIYMSSLDVEWLRKYENSETHTQVEINEMLARTGRSAIELVPGAQFIFDGVRVDVLAVKNPELRMNAINNSSVVLKVWDAGKSVVFLGDLGPEAGNKLVAGPYASKLKADYCQMAHHGQSGVRDNVYKAISPTHCLWTTPKWLWENNQGKGYNTGPWTTFETRKWAEELGVKRNYVTWSDGLVRID